MRIRLYLLSLMLTCVFSKASSQMIFGQDTLVGNEWISYHQTYYKFTIDADGVYRIPLATLQAAGLSAPAGSSIRIYSLGQQVPVYVSSDGVFGADDFVEFFGFKNRGDFDHHLFRLPDMDMLNPDHSMYTDLRPYYLTVEGTEIPLRVTSLSNDVTNPPSPEPFYIHQERIEYATTMNDPYFQIEGGGAISYSSYLHGEGFGKLNETNSTTEMLTSNIADGPDAILHLRMLSTNYGAHEFIVTWNGTMLDTLRSQDLQILDISYSIPLSSLLEVNQLAIGNSNSLSRHSLVHITLSYPRLTILNVSVDGEITIRPKSEAQYLVLDEFVSLESPVIYTKDGLTRMVADKFAANQIHFLWPQIDSQLTLHIADPGTTIQIVQELEKKEFVDFANDDTEYIVITHPDLMTIGTESPFIQYRISATGGGYKAKAYSILDIYEQFGYGIEKHPQSIRNFVEFFHRHWPSAKMVFIVGRAIEYNRSRYANGSWEPSFFVPTFGRPGADNLLVATHWNLVPRYPIGRIAVTNAQGVNTYLNKVKEHDQSRYSGQTLADKTWIKNVMHLGGGKTTSEQKGFEATLKTLGNELAVSDYGAKIHFFQKQSTDVIGESESAQILKLLNEGCGIINYLGHSATSTFEFNINDPVEWNNKGHYPVFSAMGCSAGQIHGPLLSLSDNYVLIPDEGAIAFVSGSGSQFASALISWARPWYDYFGNLNYGATLGESILHGLQAVGNFVDPERIGSNSFRYLLEQQTLQGDPALQLHPLPGPDYVVNPASIAISPEMLNTKLDSFDLTFNVSNIGRNLRQNVPYRIQIKSPDGQVVDVKNDTIATLSFDNMLTVKLPLATGGNSGSFRLLIQVDPNDHLEELPDPDAEANNMLIDNLGFEGIEFFVLDNLVTAVYPPDFSIVTTGVPVLIATGTNSFSKTQDIVFEIDTTALFNSPFKSRDIFYDHSSTLEWSPTVTLTPDQVYYWRVSPDSISQDHGYIWSTKSFLYNPGSSPGWNQSHFHQFTANDLDQMLVDSTKRTFTFGSAFSNFNILNRFHDVPQGIIPKVVVDGVIKAEFFTGFRNKDVQAFVVAIDSLTGEFMLNPNPGLYGSANHLSFDAKCFPYKMDAPESRQALIDFVENVIPAGYYVFFYTYQQTLYPNYYAELWEEDEAVYGKSIFTMIEKQFPSSSIRSLAASSNKPYIVYFQKDRGGIEEHIAADSADVVSMNVVIKSSVTRGAHISRLVGPASKWYSILSSTGVTIPDTVGKNILSAIALSTDFNDTMIISTHLLSPDTIIADIDAKAYPYIQLNYFTEDSVSYQPTDLNMWRVLYEGFPEFIIHPDAGFEFVADTLNQGETMNLWTVVKNVSPYAMENVPVALRINGNNNTEELTTVIPELKGNAQAIVKFEKNTSPLQHDYQLLMEVNPGRTLPELNYNNNIGILPMHVVADDANPILEVTFDGFRIKDGDIVSSRPLIAIQLHDENKNLRIQDTSSFIMFLEYPSDFEARRIYFTTPWVSFVSSPDTGINMAIVNLLPELTEDGIYTLIVNAKDASGNVAGDNNYIVTFEVINAAAISYIYNYPNPFNSSTRFIYTLTGPGAPAFYKIEIVSLAGIIVSEITQEQLGSIAGGTHSTSYSWEGTDQNGNLLPAGMYLYRLVVQDESGKAFPTYNLYGDSAYSKDEWGKLVIVR